MNYYTVIVKHPPINIFDKGIMKFRQPAISLTDAKIKVQSHSLFPLDGEIVKITENNNIPKKYKK